MRAFFAAALLLLAPASASAALLLSYTPERLRSLQAQGRTIVIQFHDTTAELSRRQEEAIDRIIRDRDDQTPFFLQADLGGEEVLSALYKVDAPSTLLVFRGDRYVGKRTGIFQELEILDFVREAVSRSRAKPRPRDRRPYRPKR